MTKNKRLIIIFVALAVLTVLIIINSAVFSVRIVHPHALNYELSAEDRNEVEKINELIREHHGIRTGSSIFMLNEERTVAAVRRNLLRREIAHAEIIRLERIFPNRVNIHYILLRPYFYVEHRGQAKVFSDNGTLIFIESVSSARQRGAIGLRIDGELMSLELGSEFNTSIQADVARFFTIIEAFQQLPHGEIGRDFEYVDISNPSAIFLRMAFTEPMGTAVRMEIRAIANFTEHFRHGLSAYRHFLQSTEHLYRTQSGTLLVTELATTGQIVVTHSPD